MTKPPPLPRSRRTISDLDALINESIGKSGSYGDALPAQSIDPMKAPVPGGVAIQAGVAGTGLPMTGNRNVMRDQVPIDTPERFRIVISSSVIMAVKIEALRLKVAPSEIVERALRVHLNMDRQER